MDSEIDSIIPAGGHSYDDIIRALISGNFEIEDTGEIKNSSSSSFSEKFNAEDWPTASSVGTISGGDTKTSLGENYTGEVTPLAGENETSVLSSLVNFPKKVDKSFKCCIIPHSIEVQKEAEESIRKDTEKKKLVKNNELSLTADNSLLKEVKQLRKESPITGFIKERIHPIHMEDFLESPSPDSKAWG